MLMLTIPPPEYWDDNNQRFVYGKAQTLQLEHSLVSISKWECKHHKAFLGKKEKTNAELIDYVRCMTLTQNVDPQVYYALSDKEFEIINQYIDDPMTALYFQDDEKGNNSDTVTAELIYYWMIALNIPFECQKWHLNKLLALIRVCNIKNKPSKKRSTKDIISRNRAINAANRRRFNSRG